MLMKRAVLSAAAVSVLATAGAAAQTSCAGIGTCNLPVSASVTVPALVAMSTGSGAITLTAPTADDLVAGQVTESVPLELTVRSNRSWRLQIHTTAAANWTYVGTDAGVKPISDLEWSTDPAGAFTAITGTAADVVTAQPRTNGATQEIYFRTLYSNDFTDARNAPGTYTIPLVFTLVAP